MYYANKKSGRWCATRSRDGYTNLGYNYAGNIFRRTLSKVILGNDKNYYILLKIESMIAYLIETVKQIRCQFLISVDKNDTRLN